MGFMHTIFLLGCQRYDILNKLYQDSGQWNKALDICENNDRIHLRNTYYNFAKVHGTPTYNSLKGTLDVSSCTLSFVEWRVRFTTLFLLYLCWEDI